jgi:hypothetical protein
MSLQTVRSTKVPTAGFRSVVYRDTNGKTWEGKVIGPGSVSGLMLELVSLRTDRASRIRDDVPPATTMKSTNAYFFHWSPTLTLA